MTLHLATTSCTCDRFHVFARDTCKSIQICADEVYKHICEENALKEIASDSIRRLRKRIHGGVQCS